MALLNLRAALATSVAITAIALPQAALAQERSFNVPAQTAVTGINELARQADIQILVSESATKGKRTKAVKGRMTVKKALAKLLSGTGLKVASSDGQTFTLKAGDTRTIRPTQINSTSPRAGEAKSASSSGGADTGSVADQGASEEIIVTAQKREERLLDVPVPVSTLSPTALTQSNRNRLQDFAMTVPSFMVSPAIQSNQTLAIRGVTTGSGNPTVGITIDDVPFGSSTNLGGGRGVPDIDPGDLARIEVLRGPQGTLYGASSLGGLLKFVTEVPNTRDVVARLQGTITGVSQSDDVGRSLRGSINVPVSETLAIRASGFTRRDAGWVDNIQTGEDDINNVSALGGRLALHWQPSDRFSLDLAGLVQELKGYGSQSVDPALPDLQQSRLRETGRFKRNSEAYSAIATVDFGSLELKSLTGYGISGWTDSFDLSFALASQAQLLYGVPGVNLISTNQTKKLSQELRVSGGIGENIDWLLGGFYTSEDSNLTDERLAIDPATGNNPGRLSFAAFPTKFEEYAAFGNITFRLGERFDVQFGARQSYIEQRFEQRNISASGLVTSVPALNTEGSAFTYLVTPRFRPTSDLMIYARIASGYRAGGSNINPGGAIPAQYDPDKTQNYELGLKGSFFDGKLIIDASVFHIIWNDIQLALVSPPPSPPFNFTTNGSKAKSEGFELSGTLRPMIGLTIAGWAAYNNAKLTEPLPIGGAGTAVGAAGERLPYAPRWSGSVSIDQDIPLGASLVGFVGGTASYVGERIGPFRAVPVRQLLDDYTQVDLRAGIRHDRWTANAFVTNLTDARGSLYGGLGALPATAFTYIQPRTYGLSLTWSY